MFFLSRAAWTVSRQVERIARVAYEVALKRGKRLCSVDKANVLDVSQVRTLGRKHLYPILSMGLELARTFLEGIFPRCISYRQLRTERHKNVLTDLSFGEKMSPGSPQKNSPSFFPNKKLAALIL